MSIVANYARMTAAEAEAVAADPEKFWAIPEMSWDLAETPGIQASECLYIDQDWLVLSWLCSDLGRTEERNQTALMHIAPYQKAGMSFEKALASAVEAMGFEFLDVKTLPEDPVLTAIQGRREGDDGEKIDDLGVAASSFSPVEVSALASALNGLDETWLRQRFDGEEMEQLGLPWDGGDNEFDEVFFPQLGRLRTLYDRAAKAGQHVVVALS